MDSAPPGRRRFTRPEEKVFRRTDMWAVVPFRLESDLRESLATWLHALEFDVRDEVPILRHRADLVGLRRDGVTAIEMKLYKWDQALRQAIAYQLAADWAWVAMPLSSAWRAYRERWRFQKERVGLLAIDECGRVRAPIPAGPSPRLLPFLRERVLQWWAGVDKVKRLNPAVLMDRSLLDVSGTADSDHSELLARTEWVEICTTATRKAERQVLGLILR